MRPRPKHWSHVVGFDDAPFPVGHRGDVLVVGAVFAGGRLDGVLSCRVRRDGANATAQLAACVKRSRFHSQLHAVLLQGIAFAGFNVVDIDALAALLARPVLVIIRHRPDLARVRNALLTRVRGGKRKWRLVERAPVPEQVGGLWIQRAGLSVADAAAVIRRHARHGALPEPLRTAHLIAGGVVTGESSGRA